MKKKRYRVTVKSIDAAAVASSIGTVVIEAADRAEAERLALQKLWTPQLEASGARPETHAERITGEGG